jgi:anti-sigma B factor antagonist
MRQSRLVRRRPPHAHQTEVPPFVARVVEVDGEHVVAVRGEVDPATREEFWSAVEFALEGRQRVIIDMSETTFMDAAGLAVICEASRRLGQAHGNVVVREPSATVRRVLQITGVDHEITIDDGTTRALAAGELTDM